MTSYIHQRSTAPSLLVHRKRTQHASHFRLPAVTCQSGPGHSTLKGTCTSHTTPATILSPSLGARLPFEYPNGRSRLQIHLRLTSDERNALRARLLQAFLDRADQCVLHSSTPIARGSPDLVNPRHSRVWKLQTAKALALWSFWRPWPPGLAVLLSGLPGRGGRTCNRACGPGSN